MQIKDSDSHYKRATTIASIIAVILAIVIVIILITDGKKIIPNKEVSNGEKNKTTTNTSLENSSTPKSQEKDFVILYEDGNCFYANNFNEQKLYINLENANELSSLKNYSLYDDFKFVKKADLKYEKSEDYDDTYTMDLQDADLALYSKNEYNIMPREIKKINKLSEKMLKVHPEFKKYKYAKAVSVDLDNDKNNTKEIVVVLNNGKGKPSKIILLDNKYKQIAELVSIKDNKDVKDYFCYDLDDIAILDVDNDGIMEILVEIPAYEGYSSLNVYKYENAKVSGNINCEVSLMP